MDTYYYNFYYYYYYYYYYYNKSVNVQAGNLASNKAMGYKKALQETRFYIV